MDTIIFNPLFISRSSLRRIFWLGYFTFGLISLELDESGIKFKQNKKAFAISIIVVGIIIGSWMIQSQAFYLFLPIAGLIAVIIPPLILFRSTSISYREIVEIRPSRLLEQYLILPRVFIFKGVLIRTSQNSYFIRGINSEKFIEKINQAKKAA